MPHPWPVFTPEDNHTVLTRLGTGSATTLAYHAAVTAEIAHLESITTTSSASGAGTYGVAWQGVGAGASAVSQAGLNTATTALGAWLAAKLPLVAATVSAYHSAAAAMVPAEEAVANRVEEAADEQINPWVWGALTPRIAYLNLDYFGHMWPRNAAAGAAYGAAAQASAAALLAVPPPVALAGGSVAAPAAAAATVAEDGGVGAAGAAMRSSVQAAEAVITSAGAAPQVLSQTAGLAPAAVLGGLRPLAGFQASAAAMTPSGPVGMFAPMQAAVSAPAVEAAAASEAGQLAAGPRGGAVAAPGGMAYPGAGLTSYVRPADAFSAPASGGRPVAATPGMLNAAAVRGTPTNSPTVAAAQPVGFGSGQAPLAPLRREPIPRGPTTTTATPTPTQPSESDAADLAKLHREVDDFSRRWTDFEGRVAAHNRKPTDYDMDDPVQRQAYDAYQREQNGLRAEEDRLLRERNDLREKVLESGLTIVNGEVQWPDASTTATPRHR